MKKPKLATLKDRLDNPLKDDHTALEQLAKTLPLSDAAKKKASKTEDVGYNTKGWVKTQHVNLCNTDFEFVDDEELRKLNLNN